MRIALINSGTPLDGGSIRLGALGGSETALIQAAESLAGQGHQVSVIADCPHPGTYGRVAYHDLSNLLRPDAGPLGGAYEALIVSRNFRLIDRMGPIRSDSTKVLLWLHDILDDPPSLASRLDRLDRILCLSEFHLQDTARRLPGAGEKLALTRNGLDLDLIVGIRAEENPRRIARAIYASRPERGLRILLERIWPRLRAAIPDLELSVCGYQVEKQGLDPDLLREYEALDGLIRSLPGVRDLGPLAKKDYYRLLASSGFLLYPCSFAEISCLTVLEAQALGTPLVTSKRFALEESVREPDFLVPGRPGSDSYCDLFVERVLALYQDQGAALAKAEKAAGMVLAEHDWQEITAGWVDLIKGAGQGGPRIARAAKPEQGAAEARYQGRSWEAENLEALERFHPGAKAWLDGPGAGPAQGETALFAGPDGKPLLKAREPGQRWVALHSARDPLDEAGRLIDAEDLQGAELVAVLGFGLGFHLEELASRLAPETKIVVLDPGGAALIQALKARDLRGLLARPGLELILDPAPDQALTALGRIQIREGFPELKVMVHKPSRRAMPTSHGLTAERLGKAEKTAIGRRLSYPKFQGEKLNILILHGKYFLLQELKNGLTGLGHNYRLVMLRQEKVGAEEVMAGLIREIVEFRPDFILTVNHLGFDRDGVLTGFLSQIKMPFASWYVDSPLLIIRHYAENRSPWGSIFLWDSDYLPELKSLGYEHLHYLPLGTDQTIFKPMAGRGGDYGFGTAFVGNSMQKVIEERKSRMGLSPEQWAELDRAARMFSESPGYEVLPHLERTGFKEYLDSLDEPGLVDLEALVVWRATQAYRLANVAALAGPDLTIAGDSGWADLMKGREVRLHPPVNYYDDLPGFYNRTRINFNATSLQMKTGLNQRVFDVPACGKFLLTDQRDQLDPLFEPGKEAVSYSSPEEARDLAGFYSVHQAKREKIARAAHRRALAEHTYAHRLAEMIRIMKTTYS